MFHGDVIGTDPDELGTVVVGVHLESGIPFARFVAARVDDIYMRLLFMCRAPSPLLAQYYVPKRLRASIYIYKHIYTYTYTCVNMYAVIHKCVYLYMRMCICMYKCMVNHAYI